MSKNATRKRRDKARHRDQMSRFPDGTPLAFVIAQTRLPPLDTPLLEFLRTKADADRLMLALHNAG